MSKIRKLASETAIYGVSSILARIIGYALTPLHTYVFTDSQMGIYGYLYAWTAILLVIFTFGMETSFFRFANKTKDEDKVYKLTSTFVLMVSGTLSVIIFFNADLLASYAGYPNEGLLIQWLALILLIDGLLAIPFARLRHQNKSKRFALTRVVNILINVGLQLIFLLLLPAINKGEILSSLQPFVQQWYDPNLGVGYIFLSNLIANAILIILLFDLVKQIRFSLDKELLKPVLKYSIPILIMGIAGMANEHIDKILLEALVPDDFYAWDAVGVYSATYKLSVFMVLAIQAFRFAGEPFFFSQAEDKNAPELFARVLHYFIIFSLAIFVGVSLNIDLIAQYFLLKPVYRVALYLVPILLFAKLFYGIYVNMSIWFKLTDQTIYGTYFALAGAVITVIGNVILIPIIGYLGSAISMIFCYMTMCTACYLVGKKKYPIPYNFVKLLPHLLISVVLVWVSFEVKLENFWLDSFLNIIITLLLLLVVYLIEFKPLLKKA